jgi:hypothetical protein
MTISTTKAGRVSTLDRPFACLSLGNLIGADYAVNLTRKRHIFR